MYLPLRKKLPSITSKFWAAGAVFVLLILWQGACVLRLVPEYMLPSPMEVIAALWDDFPLLLQHGRVTLVEAAVGLFCGVVFGFFIAVVMDRFEGLYKGLYPLIVITQTIPTVALAPLLVLWFGYEMMPKVILIVIVTFFPITVGLLNGFRGVDQDMVRLLRSMGAGKWQIFWYLKLPGSLQYFFAALRISAAYSVVGAVISEWLGGFFGLGVYMTRVRKAFAFDKMFAVIFLVTVFSLCLMKVVDLLHKKCMPWEHIRPSRGQTEVNNREHIM